MAVRTEVQTVDDLDGSTAAETVLFGFEGVEYEIDLGPQNREQLRAALAPYVRAGRPRTRSTGTDALAPDAAATGPVVATAFVPRQRAAVETVDGRQVRAWAAEKGLPVPTQGRIPMAVLRRYHARSDRPAVR